MKIYAMQFDYMLVVTALKIALNFTVQLGFGCVSVRTGNASLTPLLGEAEESIGSFCTRTPHHPTDDHRQNRRTPSARTEGCD